MHHEGQEMYVTLSPPTTTVLAEGALLGQTQQQQLEVMDVEGVGDVPHCRALLKVVVMPMVTKKQSVLSTDTTDQPTVKVFFTKDLLLSVIIWTGMMGGYLLVSISYKRLSHTGKCHKI